MPGGDRPLRILDGYARHFIRRCDKNQPSGDPSYSEPSPTVYSERFYARWSRCMHTTDLKYSRTRFDTIV